jgi:hypothetical protein
MRIKSHAPLMHLGMTAAGILTLALIGTYFYLMWAAGRASILVYFFVAPFMLMGSLLAFFGGRSFIRLAWLGSWQLEVPDGGGVLGQPLRATLFPRRAVTPSGELQCRLRCIRIVRQQGRSSSSSNITTLWHSSWTLQSATIHPTLGLELSLPLPATGNPTEVDRQSGSGITWQLNVVIPSQGSSEEPVFDLPVRR